jgi:hypothetical protein
LIQGGRRLEIPDPIFSIPTRTVILAISLIELTVCFVLLGSGSSRRKSLAVIFIAGNFFLYRLCYLILDPPEPCHCLGTLGDWTGMSAETVNLIGWALVAYLLVGSIMSLVFVPLSEK